MQRTEIVVNNLLGTGTAFGVTLTTPPQAVFIPGKVASSVNAEIGDRFIALLVPNAVAPERTPWMAARLEPALPLPPVQQTLENLAIEPTTAERVREIMRAGGVWTLGKMFELLFPGATRGDSMVDYNAVSHAMRAMFEAGECAKFQLWRRSDQERASREWFTCNPEKADVDEWEE
jgi:hypothetical protein